MTFFKLTKLTVNISWFFTTDHYKIPPPCNLANNSHNTTKSLTSAYKKVHYDKMKNG